MTDLWIVLAGALAGMSCALLGSFLVLRRMSMMGDAISHAVLPGLAIAFAITQSRDAFPMVVGAVAAGLLAALLTQVFRDSGRMEEGASMGVVFTLMFAFGLVLLQRVAHKVDLDMECVLFGVVELVPLAPGVAALGGTPVPIVRLLFLFMANLLGIALLYKEWKISSFDPALAEALGYSAKRLHYLLMVLVSVTTVFCFEIVGSILVIAMLIVPAACARMLSDRLFPTLVWAVALSMLFAVVGHVGAVTLPDFWGYADTASSGGMAVAGGLGFLLCVVFAPRHGLLRQVLHQRKLNLQTLREDVLGTLYRAREDGGDVRALIEQRRLVSGVGGRRWRTMLASLRRSGWIEGDAALPQLSENGLREGARLLRSHRLWEGWLHEHTALGLDHLHLPAEELEHITTPALRERLADELSQTSRDPMGREIPRK